MELLTKRMMNACRLVGGETACKSSAETIFQHFILLGLDEIAREKKIIIIDRFCSCYWADDPIFIKKKRLRQQDENYATSAEYQMFAFKKEWERKRERGGESESSRGQNVDKILITKSRGKIEIMTQSPIGTKMCE